MTKKAETVLNGFTEIANNSKKGKNFYRALFKNR